MPKDNQFTMNDEERREMLDQYRRGPQLRKLIEERDSARAIARVLAHAYTNDNRPPAAMVSEALRFPVFPEGG